LATPFFASASCPSSTGCWIVKVPKSGHPTAGTGCNARNTFLSLAALTRKEYQDWDNGVGFWTYQDYLILQVTTRRNWKTESFSMWRMATGKSTPKQNCF
jgi:hypothetical protein